VERTLSLLSQWVLNQPSVISVYAKKPIAALRPGFSDLDLFFVTRGFESLHFYRDIGQLYKRLSEIQGEVPGKKIVDNPPFCLPEVSFILFSRTHQWDVSKWELLCGKELRKEPVCSISLSAEEVARKLITPGVLHGDDASNFCTLSPCLLSMSPGKTQKIARTAIKIAFDDPLYLASEYGQSVQADRMKEKIQEISLEEYRERQESSFYVDLLLFWCSIWKNIFEDIRFSSIPLEERTPPSGFLDFCQNHVNLLGGIRSVLHSTLPYEKVQVVFFVIDPSRESELRDSLCDLAAHFFGSFEQHAYAKFLTEEQLAGYCLAWPWELAALRETCSVAFGDTSILDRLPAPDVGSLEKQGQRGFFPFWFTSPLIGFEYLKPTKNMALMRYYQYLLFGCCLGNYLLLNRLLPLSPSHMLSLLVEKLPASVPVFERVYTLYQGISPHSFPLYEQTWKTLFPLMYKMFHELRLV
jgi:hypothetical protein